MMGFRFPCRSPSTITVSDFRYSLPFLSELVPLGEGIVGRGKHFRLLARSPKSRLPTLVPLVPRRLWRLSPSALCFLAALLFSGSTAIEKHSGRLSCTECIRIIRCSKPKSHKLSGRWDAKRIRALGRRMSVWVYQESWSHSLARACGTTG